MEHRIAEQEATGHKPSALYIRLLDAARKQVQEEYAAALGLSIEEADRVFEEGYEPSVGYFLSLFRSQGEKINIIERFSGALCLT